MDSSKHALVLTGTLQPGYQADQVWPALASYFRMETAKVTDQLVPRSPVTVKESEDLVKLQGLQDGLRGLGADSEIFPLDERGSLFVVIGGKPRGPVPYSLVEARVAAGDWSGNVEVAKVGSSNWQAFSRLNAPAAPPSPPPEFGAPPPAPRGAPVEHTAYMAAPRTPPRPPAAAASPYAPPEATLSNADGPVFESGEPLPAGDAIHAGFWRRCAAATLDGLILAIPNNLLGMIPFLGFIAAIVVAWLYSALMESSERQATVGKMAMGLKVTDEYGNRIEFGKATGRHFAKILSAIILGIGYMMAGFTARKQGLHDSLAGTCVVFDDVTPGQPLPTERPPMPWYGWLLNVLLFVIPIVVGIGVAMVLPQMMRNMN
ncbi:RDD family protein [Tahibacter amnicola]|uniref:RDD family protein n=1 Tax=Tahibacter amnicola TaxID=2976241 RepID=A0ABY6BG21_9GAMM|nr:RDD family protein [Tahibacter amnicola]UXI68467.1 RDD family protein [Tahibacter amnicola]